MTEKKRPGGTEFKRLAQAIWRRGWIVAVAAVLCGALLLGIAVFFITPKYEATTMLYVNNTSISVGSAGFSISDSALTAAQNLVKTYVVILRSRSTLERVIELAGVDYTYEELSDMIAAGSVNDTEIFEVVVTSADPVEADRIANTIAVVLPGQIAGIVDGSSVRVVDYSVVPTRQAFPSYGLMAALGFGLGFVLSLLCLLLAELFNNTIRSEEYLTEAYPKVPLLAVIPDLDERSRGGYYGGYRSAKGKEVR
ncbi:MAG: hypothetical protein IJA48_02045 [Oscillospiraceae bacterium]|nr:hypothetical protein [Oscillospiraceae bacterium]